MPFVEGESIAEAGAKRKRMEGKEKLDNEVDAWDVNGKQEL